MLGSIKVRRESKYTRVHDKMEHVVKYSCISQPLLLVSRGKPKVKAKRSYICVCVCCVVLKHIDILSRDMSNYIISVIHYNFDICVSVCLNLYKQETI